MPVIPHFPRANISGFLALSLSLEGCQLYVRPFYETTYVSTCKRLACVLQSALCKVHAIYDINETQREDVYGCAERKR